MIWNKKRDAPLGSGASLDVLKTRRSAGLTCRDARRLRSASCDPWHGERPVLGGRWRWPFFDGSHACCSVCGCGVGMFFSSFYIVFVISIRLTGCKITHFFWYLQIFWKFCRYTGARMLVQWGLGEWENEKIIISPQSFIISLEHTRETKFLHRGLRRGDALCAGPLAPLDTLYKTSFSLC